MKEELFNVTELILKFSHNIDSNKIVIIKVEDDDRTLMKQIEDEVNIQIKTNILKLIDLELLYDNKEQNSEFQEGAYHSLKKLKRELSSEETK